MTAGSGLVEMRNLGTDNSLIRPVRAGLGQGPFIRRWCSTLLAATAAFAWAVQPVAAATTADPQASYGRSATQATNAERLAHDRHSLRGHKCLRAFAVGQAKAMAAKDELYHQDLQPILSTCRMSWVGENVASGYKTGTAAVQQGWMKSKSHRRNLLAAKYTRVAVAARRADDGTWYVAQVFGRPA